MLEVAEGGGGAVAGRKKILLTARHHAGESMANYAMEGIFDAALADDDFGRAFRARFELYAVPFMDRDGVIDGDQGKCRGPHDHNRDYIQFLYPETRAVAEWTLRHRPWMVLDMHCPWIRYGNNEEIFMVESSYDSVTHATRRFSAALLAAATPDTPYDPAQNIRYGESWNVATDAGSKLSMKGFAARQGFIAYPISIEIPFANFGAVTAVQANARALGRNIARAVWKLAD